MKTIYIDIDGVLADFKSASDRDKIEFPEQKYPQSQIGFFLNLVPLEDSLESFVELEKYFNVWILTRPSVQNPLCGDHIHFGNAPFEDWKKVVEYILKKENIT